jgi:hypothetical protein
MSVRHLRRFLPILLPLLACAGGQKRAPLRDEFSLGPYRARWVDYSRKDICQLPPRTLVSELQDSHSLLQAFLTDTGAPWRAVWTASNIALLEQGQRDLPAALNVLEQTHLLAASCPHDSAWELGALLSQGENLIRQSRVRLEKAPLLLNQAHARVELDGWRKEQPEIQEASRGQTCREHAAPTTVYYAAEDETGRTVWQFCDGAEVAKASGAQMRLTVGGAKGKTLESDYFDAAAQYPSAQVLRSPKLPPPLED